MRKRRSVPLSAQLLLAMLCAFSVGCGSGSDGALADGSTTTAPQTDVVVTTGAVTSTTAGGVQLPGASLDERSGPRVGDEVALLTGVRVARNAGFDRVVFEFRGGAMPEWSVGYHDGPFTSDGEGAPIEVAGSAFLQVRMQGASGFDLDSGQQSYDGPVSLTGSGTTNVREVVRQGDFEGVMQWIIGNDARAPFKVTTLTGPSRLVIDVANGAL